MTTDFRSRLNAAAKAATGPAELAPDALGPPWLPNGFYTLGLPCGTHRTLRVATRRLGPFRGRRVVGLLIGPENTKDYEDFGTVGPEGFRPWRRFANARQAAYGQLLWDLAGGQEIDGHTLAVERRCLVCNRMLTTPESHESGVGPECRRRFRRTGAKG